MNFYTGKNKLNRILSVFIACIMVLAVFTSSPITVSAENSSIFTYITNGGRYDIDMVYNILNEWDGHQSVEVKITNLGDNPIVNWAFQYDAGGEIDGIWNAVIFDNNKTEYIIKNAGYNYEIAPNASVTFGYTLKGRNLPGYPPVDFGFAAERTEITSGYEAKLNVESGWADGFNGKLTVKNTSDEPLEAWQLSFNANFIINDLWNGQILESENGSYTVASRQWSNPIMPGASLEIGLTAGVEKGIVPEILNVSASVVKINKLEREAENKEEIILDNSDEGLGELYIKDISSMDELENLGDEYSTQYYVRNQLLLTAYDGVPFEEIEKLAEGLNTEIVGYIEITNDYQLEFNDDVSYEYILGRIENLKNNPLVEYASINVAYRTSLAVDPALVENPLDKLKSKESTAYNWNLYDANIIPAWNEIVKYSGEQDINLNVKMGLMENNLKSDSNSSVSFQKIWNPKKTIAEYDINNPMTRIFTGNLESHGIHVAGIMAGSYSEVTDISGKKGETSGVFPGNKLYGFGLEGGGQTHSTVLKNKLGLALLIGNNVKVINISMGRTNETTSSTIIQGAEILEHFLNKLVGKGYDFLIVSAANNFADGEALYGSFYNNIDEGSEAGKRIIVVGNTSQISDKTNLRTFAGCYGDRIDILAPGVNIYSTVQGGLYAPATGTSMAAPLVEQPE